MFRLYGMPEIGQLKVLLVAITFCEGPLVARKIEQQAKNPRRN